MDIRDANEYWIWVIGVSTTGNLENARESFHAEKVTRNI